MAPPFYLTHAIRLIQRHQTPWIYWDLKSHPSFWGRSRRGRIHESYFALRIWPPDWTRHQRCHTPSPLVVYKPFSIYPKCFPSCPSCIYGFRTQIDQRLLGLCLSSCPGLGRPFCPPVCPLGIRCGCPTSQNSKAKDKELEKQAAVLKSRDEKSWKN